MRRCAPAACWPNPIGRPNSKDGNPAAASATLWISDTGAIEKTHPWQPRQPPCRSVRSAPFWRSIRPGRRRTGCACGGCLTSRPGRYGGDGRGGQIPVRIGQFAPDPNASVLDVAGFLVWEHGHPVLDRAVTCRRRRGRRPDQSPASGSTLTTALAVHQLPLSAAQRGYPVHLRAVVTYFDPGNHLLLCRIEAMAFLSN
jgi:hypothetical protein